MAISAAAHASHGRDALWLASRTLGKGSRRSANLGVVEAIESARGLLDQAEREFIRAARDDGATWHQVGLVFGITPQAAQQRFVGDQDRADLCLVPIPDRYDDES